MMFLLQHKDKGDFIDILFFAQLRVPLHQDLLRVLDTHDLQGLAQIRDGDALDAQHIVRIKH